MKRKQTGSPAPIFVCTTRSPRVLYVCSDLDRVSFILFPAGTCRHQVGFGPKSILN
jgi:hypothetical protein